MDAGRSMASAVRDVMAKSPFEPIVSYSTPDDKEEMICPIPSEIYSSKGSSQTRYIHQTALHTQHNDCKSVVYFGSVLQRSATLASIITSGEATDRFPSTIHHKIRHRSIPIVTVHNGPSMSDDIPKSMAVTQIEYPAPMASHNQATTPNVPAMTK